MVNGKRGKKTVAVKGTGSVGASLMTMKPKEVVFIGSEKDRVRWLQTALVLRNSGVLQHRLRTWSVEINIGKKHFFGMLV